MAFSSNGPYEGILNFSKEDLINMVYSKYKLYGAQGKFLEELGGILLQTEGPGVWLERTEMLKCTGSSSILRFILGLGRKRDKSQTNGKTANLIFRRFLFF